MDAYQIALTIVALAMAALLATFAANAALCMASMIREGGAR